jgi:hypothetical protein
MIQKKTGGPVQFEITEQTRTAIGERLSDLGDRNVGERARAVGDWPLRGRFLSRNYRLPHTGNSEFKTGLVGPRRARFSQRAAARDNSTPLTIPLGPH